MIGSRRHQEMQDARVPSSSMGDFDRRGKIVPCCQTDHLACAPILPLYRTRGDGDVGSFENAVESRTLTEFVVLGTQSSITLQSSPRPHRHP
jgi:hypothetical protein